jgi:peptidoglycan lytic transglycosylase G
MRKWLLALVVMLMLGGGAFLYRELERPYSGFHRSLIIEITPGTPTPEVAQLLVARGVLPNRVPFLLVHTVDRLRHRSLKAGEYLFDRPLTPLQVYRKLVQGDVYLHAVVIPEGSDRFDMARIFHQQLGMSAEAFLRVTAEPLPVRDLDPQAPSLEGFLFPDTYKFPRGASPASVVLAMLARFRHVLDSRFPQELRKPPARLHGVLTLASLVEKETPAPEERPLIAGVFTRRLEADMPLQCDPTVAYAARLDHQSARGPITERELELASPYNTYRNAGLPPGPICSSGEASMRAALDPAPGNALYFVSNNHGGHVFASSLAEHQRNVTRYRRQLAELRRAASDQTSSQDSSNPAQAFGEKLAATKQSADRGSAERRVHEHGVRHRQHQKIKGGKKKSSDSRVSRHTSSRARGTRGDPGD